MLNMQQEPSRRFGTVTKARSLPFFPLKYEINPHNNVKAKLSRYHINLKRRKSN